MAIPGVILLFLFNYMPMFGVLIAFKNFDFSEGIFGSGWADPFYNNFEFLFTSENTWRATEAHNNYLIVVVGLCFMLLISCYQHLHRQLVENNIPLRYSALQHPFDDKYVILV